MPNIKRRQKRRLFNYTQQHGYKSTPDAKVLL
jgi:hypothetical protein